MAILVFIQCCITLTVAPYLPLHAALVAACLLLTLRHKPRSARLLLALSLIPPVSHNVFILYTLVWPALWLQYRAWSQHKATLAIAFLAAFNPFYPDLYVQTLTHAAAMLSVARWYGAGVGEIDRYLLLAATTLSLNQIVDAYLFPGCRTDVWLCVLSRTSLALLPAYILRGLVVRRPRPPIHPV
jgi:hypothetical protein